MKVTVINGTEKQGVTWQLKELFLRELGSRVERQEFYLPRDLTGYCTGCMDCVLRGEDRCPQYRQTAAIDRAIRQADLVVLATPVYVYHVPGAMKNFLDHLAYRWMLHRPWPEMFGKRVVILTQCIGGGSRSTVRDLRHSLSWWGASEVGVFRGKLMGEARWDLLSPRTRRVLEAKVKRLAARYRDVDYARPAPVGLAVRTRFLLCREIEKAIYRRDPACLDGRYWKEQGWLGEKRPWKGTAPDKGAKK